MKNKLKFNKGYRTFTLCLALGMSIASSCDNEDNEVAPTPLEESTMATVQNNVGSRTNCPSSHPFFACDACWEDRQQAISGGCAVDGGGGGDTGGGGTASNARLAILDIEINLGIDIDDEFIAVCDYQGSPPSINPRILVSHAKVYFRRLLGTEKGNQLGDDLNTNGDLWLTRNEASMAKGADPLQVLGSGLGDGLAMDDVLAYIGMYLGDGSIDKYAGDLDPEVEARMAQFTRTWQPNRTSRYGK